jgi:hypothetical protein
MDRQALVRKLVLTQHLSVPERQALGATRVALAEVRDAITDVLSENRSFPPNVHPWRAGDLCYEGFFLELLADGRARLHWQRHHPATPRLLAERGHEDFVVLSAAVDAFIGRTFGGDIDGIPIQ